MQLTPNNFYLQLINGNWVDPKLLGKLPNGPRSTTSTHDYTYTDKDQHRLWQVWIETSTADPNFEMEVIYPSDVLRRADGRGYFFRLAFEWAVKEADRVNTAFSDDLKAESRTIVTQNHTQPLKLTVPN